MFGLFLSLVFLGGAIYYRNRWKKCEEVKENLQKNRVLYEDWGE
jgi:hypothetical protein